MELIIYYELKSVQFSFQETAFSWMHFDCRAISLMYICAFFMPHRVSKHLYLARSVWQVDITPPPPPYIVLYSIKVLKTTLLKRLAEAEIITKSIILVWLINMIIWCKHVHRLELHKLFNFCAAHLPVRLDIETKFLISNFWHGYLK